MLSVLTKPYVKKYPSEILTAKDFNTSIGIEPPFSTTVCLTLFQIDSFLIAAKNS